MVVAFHHSHHHHFLFHQGIGDKDVAVPVAVDVSLVAEALGTDPFGLWTGGWKPKKLVGEDVAPGE